MWRTVSKEHSTDLYKFIDEAVAKASKRRGVTIPLHERDRIVKEIYEANKKHYNLYITQMVSFISKQ